MPTSSQGSELLTRAQNYTQLVTPEGERLSDPDYDPWIADIFDDQLVALYEDMVIVRRIDTEATALQRQGQIGLWPPLLGQEAAQIGSAHALREDDFVFSSYRENGVAYVRGADLADLLRVWRGISFSGWDPFELRMATPAVIIGAQTLHAVGYALGCTLDESDSASIAYFGDGATSQGDTNEAMVFAARFAAPVVFFCQNNQWAISEPVSVQTIRPLSERAPGFGIPSIRVDGNDVLAVLAATRVALERARKGDGPTFIEAVTYRMGPHTTSDDPTRYRSKDELAEWEAKDPIARVASLLSRQGVMSRELHDEIEAKADDVARRLRTACAALADPEPLSVFDNVFTEDTSWLKRQRSQYAAYRQQFSEDAS